MENASKALIIAGAILIALLLISVGIMLFNGSSGLFNSARSRMSDQEKTMFNQSFTMYAGNRVSGSSVRELIRIVSANNKDDENPIVKINGEESPTETMKINGQTIKSAWQYEVKVEDLDANDGVIDTITISHGA